MQVFFVIKFGVDLYGVYLFRLNFSRIFTKYLDLFSPGVLDYSLSI